MSRFLAKTNTLFLHIPRTGGSWVGDALGVACIHQSCWGFRVNNGMPKKHALLSQYHRRPRSWYVNSFAFVRHPIAYYESVWMYLTRVGRRKRQQLQSRFFWHPHAAASICYNPSFDVWVENMLTQHPAWVSHLFTMYVGPEGGEFCEYIGRTENLCEDFSHILTLLGYGDVMESHRDSVSSIGIVNAGFSLDRASNLARASSVVWNARLRDRVLDQEQEIIRRFYLTNERKLDFRPTAKKK